MKLTPHHCGVSTSDLPQMLQQKFNELIQATAKGKGEEATAAEKQKKRLDAGWAELFFGN